MNYSIITVKQQEYEVHIDKWIINVLTLFIYLFAVFIHLLINSNVCHA